MSKKHIVNYTKTIHQDLLCSGPEIKPSTNLTKLKLDKVCSQTIQN